MFCTFAALVQQTQAVSILEVTSAALVQIGCATDTAKPAARMAACLGCHCAELLPNASKYKLTWCQK